MYTSQLVKQHFEGERKINKIKRDRERGSEREKEEKERVEKKIVVKRGKVTRIEILHVKEREMGGDGGRGEKVLLEAGQVSRAVYTHTHTHTHCLIH